MKEKKSPVDKFLYKLMKQIPGSVSHEHGIATLIVDETVGTGYVRATVINDSIKTIDIALTLRAETNISIDSMRNHNILFIYLLQGSAQHKFGNNLQINPLEELRSVVVNSAISSLSSIAFKANTPSILNIVKVNKAKYFSEFVKIQTESFDFKLSNLIDLFKKAPSYFHQGSYNLKLADQIRILRNVRDVNEMTSSLEFIGINYLILAMQIEQFNKELIDDECRTSLTKKELENIQKLTDIIKENPEELQTVSSLCAISLLSPAKLQQGFKFMHDRTVSDFIRNVRIDKAEELIRKSDLTISEIVYSIGLTSRSYFCKIFKKRYGCSPREYRCKLQSVEKFKMKNASDQNQTLSFNDQQHSYRRIS